MEFSSPSGSQLEDLSGLAGAVSSNPQEELDDQPSVASPGPVPAAAAAEAEAEADEEQEAAAEAAEAAAEAVGEAAEAAAEAVGEAEEEAAEFGAGVPPRSPAMVPAASGSPSVEALPGGYRSSNGTFYDVGDGGYWWSSSESSTTSAWNRALRYNHGNALRSGSNKQDGFSVRCIKD